MRRTGSNSGAVGQLIGGGAEGPLSSSINVRISSTQRGGYGTGTGSSGGGGGGGGGGGAAGGRSSAARDAYSSSTGHGRAGNSTGVASRTSSRTLKRPSSSGSKRSTGAASDSSMQQQHHTTSSGAGGGAGAQAISVPRHAAAIAPAVREYLDKTGVSTAMRSAMSLLLETRPVDPVQFLATYFKDQVEGTTPLVRSYRFVRLSRQSCQSFIDNLFASYSALEQQSAGLSADGYARLLRALCSDFPTHIVPFVFASLKKPTSERLSFEEFSAGIHAVLLYEEFFREARRMFAAQAAGTGALRSPQAPMKDSVSIPLGQLLPRLDALLGRDPFLKPAAASDDAPSHRAPALADLKVLLATAASTNDGEVSYADFVSAVYRLSLPAPAAAAAAGTATSATGRVAVPATASRGGSGKAKKG